ncbi:MAG: S8 family serine peptidase [Patescibacteria group bacterium]
MKNLLAYRVLATIIATTLMVQPATVVFAQGVSTTLVVETVSSRIERIVERIDQSTNQSSVGVQQQLKHIEDRTIRTTHGGRKDNEILVKMKGEDHVRRITLEGTDIDTAIEEYSSDEDVEFVEPNYIYSVAFVPNDTLYNPYQWNMDNPAYGGVEAEQGWDLGNGSGVIVAVLDTGVAYEDYGPYRRAPDFAPGVFVPGYDFIHNDSHPNDDFGHGTHVAGTIAQQTNNAAGVAGLAHGARIMPVKVLSNDGSGEAYMIADGIRFAADNGAQVMNMSFAGLSQSQTILDAIIYAYNKGVVMVAAVGNDNVGTVYYPAAYDQYIIAVGATRYDETRAPYSNYGSALDFVAPGGDASVDQNGDGIGDGIGQVSFSIVDPTTFAVYFWNGTSMASPHVAALAAMIIGKGIASGPVAVESVLAATADNLGAAGWDQYYGNGIINAGRAMTYAATDTPPTVTLTAPSNGATVKGTITMWANASDDKGVARVDFKVDGVTVGSDTTSSYSYAWNSTSVADGVHTITAVAVDTSGQTTTSAARSITVDNIPDNLGTLFEDGFAAGTLGQKWTESNEPDWNIEVPAEKQPSGKTSSNTVAHADQCTTSSGCFLTMKNGINTTGYATTTLTFYKYVDNSLDYGEFLRVDVWNGSSWKQVKKWTNGNGDNDTWQKITVNISAHKNSALKVRFVARMSDTSEEVEIEDVKITGQ